MKKILVLLILLSLVCTLGCAVHIFKKSPKDKEKIERLSDEVARLNELRKREKQQFEQMKRELRRQLKSKIGLDLEERGLVITLADNILFDSANATIKNDAYPVLNKIIAVIKKNAPEKNIGIEGHTDNEPIKLSAWKWKSNMELSTARANSVYHYLVDVGGLDPARLTTIGHGEFRPVADNDTGEGRTKNRRVEIVILPQYPKKTAEEFEEQNWIK